MRIANLNPALADELGAPLSVSGVAVVDPGLAARMGFRRGDVLVTVATGGGSPALSRMLRKQLEDFIGPGYEAVVELLGMIRDKIVARDDNFDSHGRLFRRLLEQNLVELTLQAQWFDLQKMLLQELPKDVDAIHLMKKFLENYDR